ncbi:hypothetical protein GCM10027022_13220 [Alpinimonas psychrophila]
MYCTYFDSGYLSRGLVLIESLREHGDNSPIYVLALDETTSEYLKAHAPENVFIISITEIEESEPRLAPLRSQRSHMEYYFTCTPLLIKFVMEKLETPGSIAIYLDADLYFFSSPNLVINDLGSESVGIIEHRYPDNVAANLAKYGRFNVGWVGFRDDDAGRAVLDWYSDRTLEWCSDKPEADKYADQGYLNSFPNFPGVKILESAGFNLAPWNTRRHRTTQLGGSVFADGQMLIFFHFHGLRKVGPWFTSSQLTYGSPMNSVLRNGVYQPYVNALARMDGLLQNDVSLQKRAKKRGNGLIGFVSRLWISSLILIAVASRNALRPNA